MSKTAILTALALVSFGATTVIIQSDFMPNAQVSANVANGYSNGLYYTNGSLANGCINDGQNWYLFKNGQKLSEIQQYMGGYYYFTTLIRLPICVSTMRSVMSGAIRTTLAVMVEQ
ncbi:hypothetical protein BKY29_06230 [Weissella confusa]|uniref:hypothetical protein n=1 Tax=Weissella confusa TaxID=1583 RepID=UPI0008FDDC07|nr:hypothetical protein [Weissella confusa]OJF03555.1 hypothetical protein BKY29_06230 [Weissella confusa]